MTWVLDNLGLIGQLLLRHLALTLPPLVLSLVLSIPIAWLAHRSRLARAVLVPLSSLLYAIPSLPLFILLPLVLGTGLRDAANVVAALTLYGIALLVPTTVDALSEVNPQVVDAATAVGNPRWRRFLSVELPLAGPTILAGLRVVAVSAISLVTVAAVLGISSLGLLFTDGFQRGIVEEILTGLVLTAVLALLLDRAVALLGSLVMPWTRAAGTAPAADPAVVEVRA